MAKHVPAFNADSHVKELNERFGRLIKNLGNNNRRTFSQEKGEFIDEGSDRYNFEVDFAYALNEIKMGPVYMQGKMFDKAAGVVNSLINHIKELEKEEVTA